MALFERRQGPRQVQPGQALVARATLAVLVDTVDLSKGGACIKRPRGWPFNIGDAVLFYLLHGAGPATCMESRVVWFKDDEVGLEYL